MTPRKIRKDGLNYAIGDGGSPKLLRVNTVLGKGCCVSNSAKEVSKILFYYAVLVAFRVSKHLPNSISTTSNQNALKKAMVLDERE